MKRFASKFLFFKKNESNNKSTNNNHNHNTKPRQGKGKGAKTPADISEIVSGGGGAADAASDRCHEAPAPLPPRALIALHRRFAAALGACADGPSRRRVVARLKAVAAQLTLRGAALRAEDLEGLGADAAALVASVQRDPPAMRARQALAIQRFCLVVEEEMETSEFLQSSGFLAAIRGGISNVMGARGGLDGDATDQSHAERALHLIPPPESFDVEAIFQKLFVSDTLPSLEEMGELVRRTAALLRREANIVVASTPCVFVGDIHGQKQDLIKNVFAVGGPIRTDDSSATDGSDAVKDSEKNAEEHEKPDEENAARDYVFLGDYVDRGPNSLQCIVLLFAAKLRSPEHVFLLRGNHESSETNRNYGFLKECHERYPIPKAESSAAKATDGDEIDDGSWNLADHPLWLATNCAFQNLPLCAVVTNSTEEAWVDSGEKRRESDTSTTNHCVRRKDSSKEENLPRKITLCAMHGGLSPFISESLDGILAIDRFRSIDDGAIADLTWADPISTDAGDDCVAPRAASSGPERDSPRFARHRLFLSPSDSFAAPAMSVGYTFSSRGRGHNFGEDATARFLHHSEADLVVRAHQCVREGFQWQHRRRILTLFSAPNYCGMRNRGAVLIVHTSGELEIVQFEEAASAEEDEAPRAVCPSLFQ